MMKDTVLKIAQYEGDTLVKEHVIDSSSTTIGRSKASDLVLDGIARVHALLERKRSKDEKGQEWFLTDMGSSVGTRLNGEYLDKEARLSPSGQMEFGKWRLEYETVEDTRTTGDRLRQLKEDMQNQRMRSWQRNAEREAEMEEYEAGLQKDGADDEVRQHNQDFEERRVATLLNLGPDGIREIYRLTPEEALDKAHVLALEMAASRAALSTIAELDLIDAVRKMPGNDDKHLGEIEKGYTALCGRLKDAQMSGFSQMIALISRAGGHELTEEESAHLDLAWKQVEQIRKDRKLTVV
jgi:pSer/pThr/pTyr-binding forkhead associated (FHA) protein